MLIISVLLLCTSAYLYQRLAKHPNTFEQIFTSTWLAILGLTMQAHAAL